MSTTLRQYLVDRGACEVRALNILQDHGIISDNAVGVEDVGNGGAAISFFEAFGTWTRGGYWKHAGSPEGQSLMNHHR